jgi:8-amino-7-oxononanoate synthase
MDTLQSSVGAEVVLDGKKYINFGGSSYLGLSSNPEVIKAGIAALQECGCGPPMARDQGITSRAHQEAEAEIAKVFGSAAGMFLASGYMFGLLALTALCRTYTQIFFDEYVHYSLRDAIAASGLRAFEFRHLDAASLAAQLRQNVGGSERPLIVTDGLFSTLGEIAPLDELDRVSAPYEARILVDESHSFGVLGRSGRGVREHFGMSEQEALVGGSLAKAFGCCGGIVPASEEVVALFRSMPASMGASAGSPAAAAICARSLTYFREHPELLQRLRSNIKYLKDGLRRLGLEVADSEAPVAAFTLGTRQAMQALKAQLKAAGIFVYHSTYVGAGTAGVIRVGIFADHTREHLARLLEALRHRL